MKRILSRKGIEIILVAYKIGRITLEEASLLLTPQKDAKA